jgi:two-component system, NarL family, nitrate/nitrite response regulator NarL
LAATVVTPESPPGSTATAARDLPVMCNPIRVLIAEDQPFIADALHSLLSRQPGMVVVGTTDPLLDSLASVLALQPDVVLLEFRQSEESIETVRAIQAESDAKVIFLTHAETENTILAAIEYAASAVLSMSTAADEVIRAVRLVAEGGTLITPPTIASALKRRRKTDGLRDRLTSREREVLSLMSEGSSNREIATRMGISYTTVRSHVRHVASKLAAHSKLEVLVKAQRLELVDRSGQKYGRDFAANE